MIDNNLTANQHIRVISEGSCDDWSGQFSFDHRNKLHLKILSKPLKTVVMKLVFVVLS